MQRIAIVVADAARARLYTYEPADDHGGALVEHVDLVDPERRLRPSERHSDSRPGTAFSPTGLSFGVDDHRDDHQQEVDRRFAGEIYRQLVEMLTAHPARHVVIVASPNMLGLLRLWTGGLARRQIELTEISRDLTRETTPQLQDHLAQLGLLPARARLGLRTDA